MIKIITLDEQGRVTADEQPAAKITLPIVGDVLADRIYLNAGLPALGTAALDAWLSAWHAQHNPQVKS